MPYRPVHGEYNPDENEKEDKETDGELQWVESEPKEEKPVKEEKSYAEKLKEKRGEVHAERELKREEREQEKENKKIEREKEIEEYEKKHPHKTQAKHVYHNIKKGGVAVGHQLKQYRTRNPPGTHLKRLAKGRKQRRSLPQQRVNQEVNYGGREQSGFARGLSEETTGYQRPQINLLGNDGPRREIDLLGNRQKKMRHQPNIDLLGNNKKKIRLL